MSPKALESRKQRMIAKLAAGGLTTTYDKARLKKHNPDLYEDWRQYNL